MMTEAQSSKGRTLEGRAIRSSRQQSVVVEMVRLVRHPKYHKYVRRRSRLMAHDAEGRVEVGDWVRIRECRPISKRKSWRVEAILARDTETTARTPVKESQP